MGTRDIAALEERIAELEAALACVRSELAAASTDAPPSASPSDRPADRIGRRDVLRRLGASAAAGAAGVVALSAADASSAAAAPGQPMIIGTPNDAGINETGLTSGTTVSVLDVHGTGTGLAVNALSDQGPAIYGRGYGSSTSSYGVKGETNSGFSGVHGTHDTYGIGVYGYSNLGHGVYGDGDADGKSTSGSSGVYGFAHGTGPGVTGESNFGPGVKGLSGTGEPAVLGDNSGGGPGVKGLSNTSQPAVLGENSDSGQGVKGTSPGNNAVEGVASGFGASGVYGTHTATGWGVAGDSSAPAFAGVFGRNNTTGVGVYGTSSSGIAIRGESSGTTGSNGIGVYGFAANGTGLVGEGRAPLRLTPQTYTGPPTTRQHRRGELLVDAVGDLYLCTANGTPGTWRKVVLA
jgi:hypothetical protein